MRCGPWIVLFVVLLWLAVIVPSVKRYEKPMPPSRRWRGVMRLQTLHDELVIAIAIMDEKGRENKDAYVTLWLSDWYRLRESLLKCLDSIKAALAAMEENGNG